MTAQPFYPKWSDREYGAPPGEELADVATDEGPRVERIGPSYRVVVGALELTFREVRTDRELTADVAVAYGGLHRFRTTGTLSLTARDRLAKTLAELAGIRAAEAREAVRLGVFAAVEAVLAAEEQIGAPIDLRRASLELPAGGLHVMRPLWPTGSGMLVMPGDAGKSTMLRALAVSAASGRVVIPGVDPIGGPRPVLYVAAEDPTVYWHSRNIEAICRGLGIERRSIAQPVELFDARGRPLHRIARALAERAADYGAIILDSQQALLAQIDGSGGGVRDRDSLFWHAVDQSTVPTFIIAHPNRADARDWSKADGRVAGSEVNRDRARIAWRGTWRDEQAVIGTSFRRYTLTCTKYNHGPRPDPLAFAAGWQFGHDDDPGVLTFTASEPDAAAMPDGLTPAMRETLRHYQEGATTPALLRAVMPSLSDDAARQRLSRIRKHLGEAMEGEA